MIDISDQRLYQFENGLRIGELPVSTGNGRAYRSGGRTYIGHTPRGNFRVGRKIQGWRTSRLGRLYFPSYFVGGYAIHGGHLPGYPASHGCVRVTRADAKYLLNAIGNGMTVYLYGGKHTFTAGSSAPGTDNPTGDTPTDTASPSPSPTRAAASPSASPEPEPVPSMPTDPAPSPSPTGSPTARR